MKILVIGGMHGNEPLGLEIVKLFQEKPIKNVDAMLANEQAIAKKRRFVVQDLNRTFPGDTKSKDYEQRRAAEILKLTKSYDIVLDFHNTHCPNNDCGFVGESANQKTYSAASLMGLRRVIVADYDCINKYASNCLSVEVSLDSQLNDAKLWYKRISILSMLDRFSVKSNLEKYRFVHRMSLEDRDRYNISGKKLKAFEPLDPSFAADIGVDSPAYPIFIADQYTPYNYGGLLNRLTD